MKSWFSRAALVCAALLPVAVGGLGAQDSSATIDPKSLRVAFARHDSLAATSPFRSALWTFIGPTNLPVRSEDVAIAERPGRRRIYATYKTSGLWKSDDEGKTWLPLTDRVPFIGMSVVTVAPSNPDIVWIGTASGVFKSVDAGAHWTYSGLVGAGGFELQDEATFGRIIIHPKDPRIVYVAAQGVGDNDNETRGVFKTIDGGKTWKRVLWRGPTTGAIDLVMDPRDPQVLYAAAWQRIYRPNAGFGQNIPDSNRSSIFKTRDGGATWAEADSGLPAPRYRGRMGIDIARSNPDVLYILLDSFELLRSPADGETNRFGTASAGQFLGAEVYRSSDGARSWTKVSRSDRQMIDHGADFGAGLGQIRVDPFDENVVLTGGVRLHRSTNGGRDFNVIGQGAHSDHRGIQFDQRRRGVFYDCSDGGMYIFSNHGGSFRFTPLPTTQFYDLAVGGSPLRVFGSVQDHHGWSGLLSLGQPPVAFDRIPGYEISSHTVDSAGTVLFTTNGPPPGSGLIRVDLKSGAGAKSINPSVARTEPPLRRAGLQPVIISRHAPRTVYTAYQYVFKSSNLGDRWDRISPDLTATPDTTGRGPAGQAILSLAESPLKQGLLYAGTPSRLLVTRDDGKSWADLTANLVERRGVPGVVASAFDTGTVYLWHPAGNALLTGGLLLPFIFKSTDYGKSFVSITANLPTGPVRVVREDPGDPRILYAGTQAGVYITRDGGQHWDVLGDLPYVPVTGLQFDPANRLIVISTLGRGIWAMERRAVSARR
jgi:photosystem II stability/assembly factor-like uncharacterized protein